MVVLVTCKNNEDPLKMKAPECSQYFSHNKSMEIFSDVQGGPGKILPNFEPIKALIAVLVTCKNKIRFNQK